jgi:CheY-like chemotaxis protein
MNRSDAKTVTIFACTANTFKEDRDRALESGMNDFLSKPIDVNKMIEKIGGGSHHK